MTTHTSSKPHRAAFLQSLACCGICHNATASSPPRLGEAPRAAKNTPITVSQSHGRLGPAPPTDALPASGPAPTRPGHLGWSPGGWRCNRSTAPSSPRNAAPRRFQPQHQPWPPVCAARALLRFRRWFHPAAPRCLNHPKETKNPGTRREAAKHQLAHQPSAPRLTPPASRTPTGAARSPPLSANERTSACQPEQSPRHNIPPANSNCTSSRWSLQFLCRDARRAVTLGAVASGRAERREALIVRPMSSTR